MIAYLVFFACIVLILGLLTLGLNLQWGFTGLFNAGVVGFYAIGAYTHAILTAAPQPQYVGNLGLPWLVGVLAAMAATALAGWLIGLVTIRLRGDYLAIARSASPSRSSSSRSTGSRSPAVRRGSRASASRSHGCSRRRSPSISGSSP
jgi:ABC-type branched-subunit amino acid transport system permease subunit